MYQNPWHKKRLLSSYLEQTTKLKKTFSKASDLNAIDDKVSVKSEDEKDSHALDSKQDIKFKESDEKSISRDEEEKTASNGKASEAIDPWSVSKEEVFDETDTTKKSTQAGTWEREVHSACQPHQH